MMIRKISVDFSKHQDVPSGQADGQPTGVSVHDIDCFKRILATAANNDHPEFEYVWDEPPTPPRYNLGAIAIVALTAAGILNAAISLWH